MSGCVTCDPAPLSTGRLGEGHVALRFGDSPSGHWLITLDGADVTHEVDEARAGPDGFVVRLVCEPGQTLPICNGDHARRVIQRGTVQVVRQATPSETREHNAPRTTGPGNP